PLAATHATAAGTSPADLSPPQPSHELAPPPVDANGPPPVEAPTHLPAIPPADISTEQLVAVVSPTARLVRIEFEGDDHQLSRLLVELLARGLPVYGFTEETGDLEDVFMRVTRGIVT